MDGKKIEFTVKDESGRNVGNASGVVRGQELEVETVWVNPSARGVGRGGQLLDNLISAGRGEGATQVTGEANPGPGSTWDDIRAFYASRGIEIDEGGKLSGKV